MSVKRYYGDNGQLLRYEITKEMNTRGKRYYKRAQMVEDLKAFGVTFAVFGALTVWYLINN